VIGTKIAARLVQQPVDELFGLERHAVDADFLTWGDARAEFAHGSAIDADTAGEDQTLDMPPRADAGMGQEFVEAVHGVIVRRGWSDSN